MQGRHTADDYDQSVLESLDDAVYAVDIEGRSQFCNAALGRLTDYAVSALLVRSSTDLYTAEEGRFFSTAASGPSAASPCRSCCMRPWCARTALACPWSSPWLVSPVSSRSSPAGCGA
jgi:radical SAM protein with 4Fe4S-binding SPASM domain